jgi:hypothetical protein
MVISTLSQAVSTTWWAQHCHKLCVPHGGLTTVTSCGVYHMVVSPLSQAVFLHGGLTVVTSCEYHMVVSPLSQAVVCTTWWSHHCHKLCVSNGCLTSVTSCEYHMVVAPLSQTGCNTWWCHHCHTLFGPHFGVTLHKLLKMHTLFLNTNTVLSMWPPRPRAPLCWARVLHPCHHPTSHLSSEKLSKNPLSSDICSRFTFFSLKIRLVLARLKPFSEQRSTLFASKFG